MIGKPTRIYSGPADPTTYDPKWSSYSNLNDPPYGPATIAAFEAFPEDLTKYIGQRRWMKEICSSPLDAPVPTYITLPTVAANPDISGIQLRTDVPSQGKIAAVKQAIDNGAVTGIVPFLAVNGVKMLTASDVTALYGYVVRYVQATYTVAATLLIGVNASPPTITTRAQIDAAFASITVH